MKLCGNCHRESFDGYNDLEVIASDGWVENYANSFSRFTPRGNILMLWIFSILLDSFWIQIDQQNLIDTTSENFFVEDFDMHQPITKGTVASFVFFFIVSL